VDRARDELLAGARLASDQHARVARGDPVDELAHCLHLRTVADHVAGEPELLTQLARDAPRLAQL
jgi:hypothetical protein